MSNQYCRSCGQPNANSANFCGGCGLSLKDEASSVSKIIASLTLNKPTRETQNAAPRRPERIDYDQYEGEDTVINIPKSLDVKISVGQSEKQSIKSLIESGPTGFGREIPKMTKKAAKAKLTEMLQKQATTTRLIVGGDSE